MIELFIQADCILLVGIGDKIPNSESMGKVSEIIFVVLLIRSYMALFIDSERGGDYFSSCT